MKSNKDEPAVSQPTTPKNRAKVVTPSTPATKVADATSGGSRADYTCYTLRDSDDQILAVVLETKMDHSSQDAVAQVKPHPFILPLSFLSFRSASLSCRSLLT